LLRELAVATFAGEEAMISLSRLAFSTFATAALCTSAVVAAQAQGGRTYTTTLTGAAEVPGPGDPDGTGSATVNVNPFLNRVCYELDVSGIEEATAAHIHKGSAAQAGPIVVHLEAPVGGSSEGCTNISARLAREILARPHLYYVNVHNAPFPAGALRGQLG
jgi:hypothetical protein